MINREKPCANTFFLLSLLLSNVCDVCVCLCVYTLMDADILSQLVLHFGHYEPNIGFTSNAFRFPKDMNLYNLSNKPTHRKNISLKIAWFELFWWYQYVCFLYEMSHADHSMLIWLFIFLIVEVYSIFFK